MKRAGLFHITYSHSLFVAYALTLCVYVCCIFANVLCFHFCRI